MAEGGSSFNKFLILIILAGAAYLYYDKKIRVTKPIDNGTGTTKNEDGENVIKEGTYLSFLEKGEYDKVVNALSTKSNLTAVEKLHLGIAYKETKATQKADKILGDLYNDKSATLDNRASAKVQQVLLYLDMDDYKKGMELFNSFIKELDPLQLPVIEIGRAHV